MKKKKFSSRLLAFFLALSMAFTIMPAVNAMADSKSTASNKLKIPKLKNVKPGSKDSLGTPSEVKLEAEENGGNGVMYHASWSKVDGAYGYLLYLHNEDKSSIYYNPGLNSPYLVIGEDSTSYDFTSFEAGPHILYVRPITKYDIGSFTGPYIDKNYTASKKLTINAVKIVNNYSILMKCYLSPDPVKVPAMSELKSFFKKAPSGKKVSYLWNESTRKKVKAGDTLTGDNKVFAIWKNK